MDSLLQAVPESTVDSEALAGTNLLWRSAWLERWHLLSLDAPTVAVVWTWFAGRAMAVRLRWLDLAATFVAVWVLYAADRLLDARGIAEGNLHGIEERHLFHHLWRRKFFLGMIAASAALAAMLTQLQAAELRHYVLIGAILALWLVVIHTSARPLPKEFAVGLFFAAAIFVPVEVRAPGMRLELLCAASLVAALCTLNCLFILAWEHPWGAGAEANRATRAAARLVVPLAVGVILLCGAGLLLRVSWSGVPATCCASLVFLLVLDSNRTRIARTTLRALADVALLTPLGSLLWLR